MAILIIDMDKPKSCLGCDFNMYDCYCKINHGWIDRDFWSCDKTCPIVEIPAMYGDFINAKIDEDMNIFAELTPDVVAMALNKWRKELEGEVKE